MHELEEPQVEGEFLLWDTPMWTQPTAQERPEPFHRVHMHFTHAFAIVIASELTSSVVHTLLTFPLCCFDQISCWLPKDIPWKCIKIKDFWPYHPLRTSCAEPRTRAHPMVSGGQRPSQWSDRGRSPEMGAYKLLSTKYFHGVSSGNRHPYLLKSRYGKVSLMLVSPDRQASINAILICIHTCPWNDGVFDERRGGLLLDIGHQINHVWPPRCIIPKTGGRSFSNVHDPTCLGGDGDILCGPWSSPPQDGLYDRREPKLIRRWNGSSC